MALMANGMFKLFTVNPHAARLCLPLGERAVPAF
jgi:hypothetical protein